VEWLDVSSKGQIRRIPVDDNSNALIPYRGPPGTFRYVSISDIAKDRVPSDALRGRIALVGASAGGLLDLRVTPVSNTFIGVEMHANLLSGMLDGTIRRQPGWIPAYEVVLLAVVGVLVRLTLPRLNPLRAVFNALGMAALLLLGNFAAWQLGFSLPVAASLFLVSALLMLQMFWGYTVEVRSKRQFTRLFGQYVPPELVAEMSRNPEHYSMEGQNCELTVLFCDLRGFTSIAERLEPRQVTQLLGEFLTAMTAVIGRHRGTVDKYIGDAVMAFWGAPVANPDHARAAVETALEMQQEMVRLSETLTARGLPVLEMGVGINTGQVTVGDFGSSVRKAYTAIGDAVNLASRLEGLTRRYGVEIVVGETTRLAVPGFAWRELDRVRVKGKGAAVTIYEPLGPEVEVNAGQMARLVAWRDTLEHFRARRWSAAESGLRNLTQREPGRALYALYLERIAQLRAAPPAADWDGVVAFEYK
jgi:adenylate cyclase